MESLLNIPRPHLLEIARGKPSNSPVLHSQQGNSVRTENGTPVPMEQLRRDSQPDLPIQCPICQRPFTSVELVDLHIDSCTGVHGVFPTVSSQSYNLRPHRPVKPLSSPQRNFQLVKPLPKLNYAMSNEKQLRAKLSEHGLSTHGSKPVLIARHKEFVNVHNANIDRLHPQSQQDIVSHMQGWDTTQQTLHRTEKRKELDGEDWARRCKNDFDGLARQARESVKRRRFTEHNLNGEGTPPTVAPSKSSQEETLA